MNKISDILETGETLVFTHPKTGRCALLDYNFDSEKFAVIMNGTTGYFDTLCEALKKLKINRFLFAPLPQ